jgi:hypothetical protein
MRAALQVLVLVGAAACSSAAGGPPDASDASDATSSPCDASEEVDCGSPCPEAQPLNGSACSTPGLSCTWGPADCLSRGACKSDRWAVLTPSCILP